MSLERIQKGTHLDEVVEFAHVLVACKHGAQVLIALGASPCGEKRQWQHSLEHDDAGSVWYVRVVGRRYVRFGICVGIGDASIRHGISTEGVLDRKEQDLDWDAKTADPQRKDEQDGQMLLVSRTRSASVDRTFVSAPLLRADYYSVIIQ